MQRSLLPVLAASVALFFSALTLFGLHWSFNQPYSGVGFWHGMLFFFACSLAIAALLLLIGWLVNFSREKWFKSIAAFFSLAIILFMAEMVLRVAGINRAYIETRDNCYRSPYVASDTNVLWRYRPNSSRTLSSADYQFPRQYNSYGFDDAEFVAKTDTSDVLIQTYGDSFTEGDGAPSDSSYPAILRALTAGRGVQIQNFGVCGNDPVFCLKQLQELGSKFYPDYAVMTYSTGDMDVDMFVRKGLNRFKDGHWEGYHGPNWEWLYAESYVFRLVCKAFTKLEYDNFFLKGSEKRARFRDLELQWSQTFKLLNEVAASKGVKVLLVKKPEHAELDANKYNYDLSFFENQLDSLPQLKMFDLMPYYHDSLGVNKSNSRNYYWPHDPHHNSAEI